MGLCLLPAVPDRGGVSSASPNWHKDDLRGLVDLEEGGGVSSASPNWHKVCGRPLQVETNGRGEAVALAVQLWRKGLVEGEEHWVTLSIGPGGPGGGQNPGGTRRGYCRIAVAARADSPGGRTARRVEPGPPSTAPSSIIQRHLLVAQWAEAKPAHQHMLKFPFGTSEGPPRSFF